MAAAAAPTHSSARLPAHRAARQARDKGTPVAEKLGRSGFIVSLMTMLSRVLGMARDMVLAAFVGAGGNADALFVALRLPNFLRRLFSEGAFAQAFVPVLSDYRATRTQEQERALIARVAGCLGLVLTVVSIVGVLTAPGITFAFAPGFHDQPAKFELTAELLRITFPYILMISLAGFFGSVLNAHGRFAAPAFAPVLLNVCMIGAAVWVAPRLEHPEFAIAWSVLLAGLLQLAVNLPGLLRMGLLPMPVVDWRDPGVKRVLTLMVPALFGVSVGQINLLLDTVIVSYLPDGSVAWLYYANRLSDLPLGVVGIAVATVILPALSRQHARQEGDGFQTTLDWGVRTVITVSVPAALALLVLAEPIISTLFGYGRIGARDVHMSTLGLQAYALGLLAFMLVKVLATGFYAQQDIKTPVKIGIAAMVANMVFTLALVYPLHVYWQIGHVGLALASTCSAFFNAALLWRVLGKRGVWHWSRASSAELLKVLAAALLMSGAVLLLDRFGAAWLELPWWWRALKLGGLCIAGFGVYFATLWLLGLRPGHLRAPPVN